MFGYRSLGFGSGGAAAADPYNIDILLVAGGGGGANCCHGGGGGAGGYRSLADNALTPGVQYTVTVGDGGAATEKGSDSSFAGTGFTTLSSTGGGRGGTSGTNGGSGGGGSAPAVGAGGAGNEGGYDPAEGTAGGKPVQVTEVEAAEVPDKLVVMVDLEEEVLEEMDQQIQ